MRPALLLSLMLSAVPTPVWAQSAPEQSAPAQRVGLALVIGNSRYAQAELPSVEVDAKTMAAALQSLGFRVRSVENLQRPRDFEEELRTFLKSEEAAPEDTLVVYYSGHGIQIEGRPYLVGTGITSSAEMASTLREFSTEVDGIIRIMEQAAPSARVLIIDACRNNPFAATARKAGAAFQRGIEDTYILFADEPGKVVPARSDTTIQSPFTAGLLYAFETSESGLEERFQIASKKTRDLNSDQSPQLLKSDSSVDRNRPFLDHGARSLPTRSAHRMLAEAEAYYRAGSWSAFRNKISEARILSSEPALAARLQKELTFGERVIAALAAERDPTGPKWAAAAEAWEQAAVLFPTRPWVFEKAAIDWLLADDVKKAAPNLARLTAFDRSPAGQRAAVILAELIKVDSSLEAVAASVSKEPAPGGPEFEAYASLP